MRENTTHYTVEYTCKRVLVCKLSHCGVQENLLFQGIHKTWYLYICKELFVLVYIKDAIKGIEKP